MTVVVVFWLAIWALIIWGVVEAANRRGRDPVGWGIAAVFFGLFAYIAVAIAGETEEHHRKKLEQDEIAMLELRKRLNGP